MAHSILAPEAELRAYLIELRSEFRHLMARTLLEDSAESAEAAWAQCSRAVDPLLAGQAVRLHRYELWDGHPQAAPHGGRPTDALELGADDVIRPVEKTSYRGS